MSDIRDKLMCSTIITPFQRRVYIALLDVPSGETITYGELARRIGCRSAQAVGQALKRNPFAPEVPCHRVVAADGTLGATTAVAMGNSWSVNANYLRRKRETIDNYEDNNHLF